MEEGTLRCDANLSLRRPGEPHGTRTEIKNMNSLRAVERALRTEEARQRELLERGEAIVQQTRHWDEDRGITFASREKEEAHDYRYFPEPDLLPVRVDEAWIDARAHGPARDAGRPPPPVRGDVRPPGARGGAARGDARRWRSSSRRPCGGFRMPKIAANWIVGDVAAYLNAQGLEIDAVALTPAALAELLGLIERGVLSGPSAKEVLDEMLRGGKTADEIVRARGLVQISDEAELLRLVDEVIAKHPGPVGDLRAGKDRAVQFLVGQVMKQTRGRANPEVVNRLLRQRIGVGGG